MDRGYTKTDSTNNAKDAKGISSSAGTTTVRIQAIEDLGMGRKVGLSINTDWAEAGGLTQDAATTANSNAGNAGGNIPTAGGAFANAQSFLFIEDAKLGKVQLGNVNNEILNTLTGVGAAFSTGVGSAYSSSWSVLNGYGTGGTNRNNQVAITAAGKTGAGVRGIRQVNTVKYVSPTIEGFTVAIGQALKNDTGAAAETSTVGATDMSLTYVNGPLTAQHASLKYKVGSDTTLNGGSLYGATTTTALTANSTNTHTATAVSYAVMPTLKLSAAFGGSKASADSIANSKFTQYGVSYTMGQIDIMAQTAKVNDKNAVDFDRKMTGFGVNYNLSKTARAYVRYDKLNFDTQHAHTADSGQDIKRTAIGVSKSF